MSSRIVVALAMAAAVMVAAWQLQPSEAARYTAAPATSNSDADADALRFPGRPGSSRGRSPIVFPGFPGRPSPPAPSSGGGFPASPATPSAPIRSPPPCSRSIAPPEGFPLVPGFPGLPGSGGGAGGSPTECVAPLAGLMTCGTFLTGSEPETPTPQSDCCTGLGGFLNTSSAAAGDGNDRILRCLCPVILGDVNKMLPKPIDPVRLMYLPIACGIVLPPQLLANPFLPGRSSTSASLGSKLLRSSAAFLTSGRSRLQPCHPDKLFQSEPKPGTMLHIFSQQHLY